MAKAPRLWNCQAMNSRSHRPPTSQLLAQQNKNWRVNGFILDHLHGLNKKIDAVIAMDWIGKYHQSLNQPVTHFFLIRVVGNIGYLYCLVDQNGLYVSKNIDVLHIPTSVSAMDQFIDTLQLLFAYKVSTKQEGEGTSVTEVH